MKKLNKEEFVDFFTTKIQQYVVEFASVTCSIIPKEKLKNNGAEEGLIVKLDGFDANPFISINSLYKDYLKDPATDEAWIIKFTTTLLKHTSENRDSFTETAIKEKLKNKEVIPMLINKEMNKDLLDSLVYEDVPGTEFALVVKAVIKKDRHGFATVPLRKGMLEYYNINMSEKDIIDIVKSNIKQNARVIKFSDVMKRLYKEQIYAYVFETVANTIPDDIKAHPELLKYVEEQTELEYRAVEEEVEAMFDVSPWFILSNKENFYGATTIQSSEVLEKIYEEHGPFYLLPSSIHEFIIIKEEDFAGVPDDELLDIIRAVNSNEEAIAKEDILSNNLYYFDGELQMIE